jgi:Zn-dependent protease
MMIFVGIRPHYFVPIDVAQFTYRRLGIFVTTLASTVSHLCVVLASMYALLFSFDVLGGTSPAFLIIQQVTSSLTEWALFWAVLSLIPIPPFEGGALLPVFFGEWGQTAYDFLEPYGLFIFLSLFWVPGLRDIMIAGVNALHFLLYQGLMHLVFI